VGRRLAVLNNERDRMAPRWERKVLHGLIQHMEEGKRKQEMEIGRHYC
jgi:hypothetical protein